ncbi:MAG: hypothetical protein HOY78_02695 [Saccharothrix sp.]|nr:hypothetical protein [Saccharothrix sp.]
MSDTVKILVARTYTVHAAHPDRPDYFRCRRNGRFGAPVVVGRPDPIPVEEFLALPHACKNCKKVLTAPAPVDPDAALATLESSISAEPTPEHAAEVARRLTPGTARMILDMAAQDDRSLMLVTDYPSSVRRSADRYGLVYPIGFGDYRLTPLGGLVAQALAERTRAATQATPLTVEQAGEKISAECGEALATSGAESEPFRPEPGDLVVGTLTLTGARAPIGDPVIGVFEGVDTSLNLAFLRDNAVGLAVDIDSLRPAPQVPDASHLIGRKITAELAVGTHEQITGVVARVLRPSPDGLYVVVQLETSWIVRVPVAEVVATAGAATAVWRTEVS